MTEKKKNPADRGLLGGSDGEESACNSGDLGSIPGLERSPGGGHRNPLQYSCLENSHGQRSLTGYNPRGRKESDMTEGLKHPPPPPHTGPRQDLAEETASRQELLLLSAIRKPATGPTTTPARRDILWQGLGLVAAFTLLTLVGNSSFPRRHLIGET